jgi:methyl-accepting chemotaxis protein
MKLQTKFSLILLGFILSTLLAAQVFQQWVGRRALTAFSEENQSLLQRREELHVENLYQTVDPVVQSTIALGDMTKLETMITNFARIEGLLEYSLYDSQGRAAYSTSAEVLKTRKSLPPEIKDRLLRDPERLSRRTAEAFEVYRPMTVTRKCLECHDGFKDGAIGGVAAFRISTDALTKASRNAAAAIGRIQRTEASMAGLTMLVLMGVLILVAYGTVHRLITRPLTGVIERLQEGAEGLNGSSAEIAASSQLLADGASGQAASLEETSASLNEMAAMTRRNAESAEKADALARQARSSADAGYADMQKMQDAVEAIRVSSDDIAKIIKTIDEIAFQTNLLALNAAVEAARAGEAGMGFAVVADEVRGLARRCAESARETSAKIEGAIARTAEGVRISSEVTRALQNIVREIRGVDELVRDVALASKEQSSGISQLNSAVSQMDQITQSTAASAAESSRAAENLNGQAEDLRTSVAALRALMGGGGRIDPAAVTAGTSTRQVRRPRQASVLPSRAGRHSALVG